MNGYKIPEHTVFRETDGKAIALNLDTGQYYTMNEMAVQMWLLLQEGQSLAAIVQAIETEYDATRADIEADLASFLHDLQKSGLVEQT